MKILRHAHERVVHRHVAVRVVLGEHVTDHGRALLEFRGGSQSVLPHGIKDAAVDRLEPVAHVRQRARATITDIA